MLAALDTDHNPEPSHRASFVRTIQEAKAQGIEVALSCPCFEISPTVFLHHAEENEMAALSNCDKVQDLIRAKVGEYNKTRLNREHYADGSAMEAILRAERLDRSV